MFEKVNPDHPDKQADRIAGAIVDLAYQKSENPKIAVEVLIGHGRCFVIIESSEEFNRGEIRKISKRIAGVDNISLIRVKQDEHLAKNQTLKVRCGDNGIFKGMPITKEQEKLTNIAKKLHDSYKCDGKYILAEDKLIVCQSNAKKEDIEKQLEADHPGETQINPLGYWTGGTGVDSGATNRKLGSDMGDAVTGGGLHGKDISKADVSVNIYAHLKAQLTQKPEELHCAIGDDTVDGIPYEEIVRTAKEYIEELGGFEKFAEWGLIR